MNEIGENRCNLNAMSVLQEKQKVIDRAPFVNYKIDDTKILETIEGREICGQCYKSRKFFCYTCYKPIINEKYIPKVNLPIKIDIIKHAQEIDGKSTAIHAAIIAPNDVRIYIYPDFPELNDDEKTILIFPSKTAMAVEDLFKQKLNNNDRTIPKEMKNQLPITRAIFIDSTWHQTKSIYKDQRLRALPCVMLKSRISQFWRHQKGNPRWYLATIEAIHQLLIELHNCIYDINILSQNLENNEVPDKKSNNRSMQESSNIICPYNGEYDNLLYFFKYMYEKIHTIYDHEKLLAYKRPLI